MVFRRRHSANDTNGVTPNQMEPSWKFETSPFSPSPMKEKEKTRMVSIMTVSRPELGSAPVSCRRYQRTLASYEVAGRVREKFRPDRTGEVLKPQSLG